MITIQIINIDDNGDNRYDVSVIKETFFSRKIVEKTTSISRKEVDKFTIEALSKHLHEVPK